MVFVIEQPWWTCKPDTMDITRSKSREIGRRTENLEARTTAPLKTEGERYLVN